MKIDLDAIAIPDEPEYPETTEVSVAGDYVFFVTKGYDESPLHPLKEFDEMGSVFSFNSHWGEHADDYKRDALLAEFGSDAVMLHYTDGNDFEWYVLEGDESAADGVWVPDDALIGYAESAGEKRGSPERTARMRKYAAEALTEYNDYINGNVFRWRVVVYRARRFEDGEVSTDLKDYKKMIPVEDESCSGIYDDKHNYLDAEVRRAVGEIVYSLNKDAA